MKYIFPAEHSKFYKKFDEWRLISLKSDLAVSGVYEFLAGKKINRLIGVDEIGILYIGKGVILESNNRVGKFVNAINSEEAGHMGGMRHNLEIIKSTYPISDCNIRITLTLKPDALETEMLQNYLHSFGELPPLNRILT